MFAGALLDLGAGSPEMLESALGGLGLRGWSISWERRIVNGISAGKFDVKVEEEQEPKSYAAIKKLIRAAGLPEAAQSHCLEIFGRLAAAEAAAHGESLESVHFHEVGMVDSIIDIVSACLLMEDLSPDEVLSSPVALGSGWTQTMHGQMPVPAPATASLLKGIPLFQGSEEAELTTPTGAALISHFAGSFGPLPPVTISAIGYGAGSRKTKRPNLLRCIKGERAGAGGEEDGGQLLIETNVDDSTPEQLAYLAELLIHKGAADAWLTPVIMKKGRPGVVLSVLCPEEREEQFLDMIFSESSTFGVRATPVKRRCLEREIIEVGTPHGTIRVKIGYRRGKAVTISPEYEDCREAALAAGVPIAEVYAAARQTAAKRSTE